MSPLFFYSLFYLSLSTSCLSTEIYNSTSDTCVTCPEGQESNEQQTQCTDCMQGYYSTQLTNCLKCPSGSYSNTTKSTTCTLCTQGYYSPTPGQSECLQCPPLTYSTTSFTTCEECPDGSIFVGYSGDIDNNTVCVDCNEKVAINNECLSICEDGYYYYNGTCTLCEDGYYCTTNNKEFCGDLGANTYCLSNTILHCTNFISTANTKATGCEISTPFTTTLISISAFLLSVILICGIFIASKIFVTKKVMDFSVNNAQETDPAKVYLLSF
ncbi:Tyrosine-protein kinase ephrin type A/B receptor-like domain-containing protein [Entamoeba marina]